MVYDEVSLVDAGANQHAHVVIVKRQDDGPSAPAPKKSERKANWYASNREATVSGSGKGKKSQRAQNWDDGKHPRKPKGSPAGGEFDKTSEESKRKYGKGGTTKAKQTGTATHKTVKGDTLWALAEKHYGDGSKWKLIAKANGIKDPKKLPIGMELKIPGSKLAKPEKTASAARAKTAGSRLVMEPGGRVHQERIKADLRSKQQKLAEKKAAAKKREAAKKKKKTATGIEKIAAQIMFESYTGRR
ncbi:LysM peptidoglycan-binding domain-containing protein [Streptomyces sp. NPDC006477]|uniref:LysM peptidoglycan-binding domain-containing protein n=1 Tax=Streptomyces sp. NPDC006477 TaxID=3364747 RepID=UPI00369799D7